MFSSDGKYLLEVVAREGDRNILSAKGILQFEDDVIVVASDHKTVIVSSLI